MSEQPGPVWPDASQAGSGTNSPAAQPGQPVTGAPETGQPPALAQSDHGPAAPSDPQQAPAQPGSQGHGTQAAQPPAMPLPGPGSQEAGGPQAGAGPGARVCGPPEPVPPRVVLPTGPSPYHSFWRAPSYRWWKGLLALVMFFYLWFYVTLVGSLVYMLTEMLTRPEALDQVLRGDLLRLTMDPGAFLVNNVTIAAMIPSAYVTQWVVVGQRPRWLSSVTGRFRWGWLGVCLAGMLPVYLVVTGVQLGIGGLPDLEWKPYTVFMIATVLLTTPLQSAGEELGLRGLVNRAAASWASGRLSWWLGAVVSGLLFASLHLAQDLFLNFFYFSFGMLACWLVRVTGGLEASVAWHVVNNLTAMWVLPFTDFSGMFDRSAGSVSTADAAGTLVALVLAPAVLWLLARWRRPVAVQAGAGVSAGQPTGGTMAETSQS